MIAEEPCHEYRIPTAGQLSTNRGQRLVLADHWLPILSVVVDTGRAGSHAGHQRRPRRVADWRGTVRTRERNAHLGHTIKIRSARLRISTQVADPMIQVVDRDEQHVGLLLGGLVVGSQVGCGSRRQDQQ